MNVRDDLVRVIDGLLSDDPHVALVAFRRLAVDELPWLEQRAVAVARCSGWNWATIGRMLGMSRQGSRKRFDAATWRADRTLSSSTTGRKRSSRVSQKIGGVSATTTRSPGEHRWAAAPPGHSAARPPGRRARPTLAPSTQLRRQPAMSLRLPRLPRPVPTTPALHGSRTPLKGLELADDRPPAGHVPAGHPKAVRRGGDDATTSRSPGEHRPAAASA